MQTALTHKKIHIQPIYLVLERRANQSIHYVASYPEMQDILWTKNMMVFQISQDVCKVSKISSLLLDQFRYQ